MVRTVIIRAAIGLAAAVAAGACSGPTGDAAPRAGNIHGVLVTPERVSSTQLRAFSKQGANAVVLSLTDGTGAARVRAAVKQIQAAGLAPYYWIEVGRSPALATAHPEWMASLQGHAEWRRFFPHAPQPRDGEVVKNFPWVPVLYREAFAAQLQRVGGLLRDLPPVTGVFLNDLQAAPSACGCGNLLCRWTPDYGPIQTATRLPADAAARFVAAVHQLVPASTVIPVWTTECEKEEKNASCAGVACFQGACWRDYTAQLMPVAKECDTLAALCLYRAFGRDLPRYGGEAGWIGQALDSFVEMPAHWQGQPIPTARVIAVLQGWDVTNTQCQAQIQRCQQAGAQGYVMSLMRIDQGWEPRLERVPLKPPR